MTRSTTCICDACTGVIAVLGNDDELFRGHQIGVYVDKDHKRVWELCPDCVAKGEAKLVKLFGVGQAEEIQPSMGEVLSKLVGRPVPTEPAPKEAN